MGLLQGKRPRIHREPGNPLDRSADFERTQSFPRKMDELLVKIMDQNRTWMNSVPVPAHLGDFQLVMTDRQMMLLHSSLLHCGGWRNTGHLSSLVTLFLLLPDSLSLFYYCKYCSVLYFVIFWCCFYITAVALKFPHWGNQKKYYLTLHARLSRWTSYRWTSVSDIMKFPPDVFEI